MNYISDKAKIGEKVVMGENVIVMDDVVLEEGVQIGNNVIIYPGCIIGHHTQIGDNVVIGKQPTPAPTSTVKIEAPLPPTRIGPYCIIGTSAIIYSGTKIGKRTMVADLASIRENCQIGDYVIVGRGVVIDNDVKIGNFVKLQSLAYICALTTIEDYVFIAPCVVTTNDNFMGRTEERFKHKKGAYIEFGARVGANSILLPGIRIGREAFVAAGAIVTKDVPPYKLVKGIPARVERDVPQEEWVENQKEFIQRKSEQK
ncbi:N-acetyltransferase [bacterium]|nr:N-acetyltransferase [bacterium]